MITQQLWILGVNSFPDEVHLKLYWRIYLWAFFFFFLVWVLLQSVGDFINHVTFSFVIQKFWGCSSCLQLNRVSSIVWTISRVVSHFPCLQVFPPSVHTLLFPTPLLSSLPRPAESISGLTGTDAPFFPSWDNTTPVGGVGGVFVLKTSFFFHFLRSSLSLRLTVWTHAGIWLKRKGTELMPNLKSYKCPTSDKCRHVHFYPRTLSCSLLLPHPTPIPTPIPTPYWGSFCLCNRDFF